MYTITATKYHNDLDKVVEQKQFASLDLIFDFLKRMSFDFQRNSYADFPTPRGRELYDWVGRIQVRNEADPYYYSYWIHKIEDGDWILFSDGRYTDGQRFCSGEVQAWLEKSNAYVKNRKFNFAVGR